jgi:hypothetical protein
MPGEAKLSGEELVKYPFLRFPDVLAATKRPN